MTKGKTLLSHHDRDGLTLQEIANTIDLTKERVRQIEARALMKSRATLVGKNITPADHLGGML